MKLCLYRFKERDQSPILACNARISFRHVFRTLDLVPNLKRLFELLAVVDRVIFQMNEGVVQSRLPLDTCSKHQKRQRKY